MRGHNCKRCGHWIKEDENGYFVKHKKSGCMELMQGDISELRASVTELQEALRDLSGFQPNEA